MGRAGSAAGLLTAVALKLAERALVQIGDELADLPVQLAEAEEAMIAQPRKIPALNDLHADFDLRLIVSQQLLAVMTIMKS
jgi:hypothetical protein